MLPETIIRSIHKKDNKAVAALIRGILVSMGVPEEGTAYGDVNLDVMFETYQKQRSMFYVVEVHQKIVGCGGIAPLEGYRGSICELQKMYVAEEYRGQGLATKIMNACLETAESFGFEGCYLETMPTMQAAQHLYKKNGFEYLKEPLGDTGHSACTVRMMKTFP